MEKNKARPVWRRARQIVRRALIKSKNNMILDLDHECHEIYESTEVKMIKAD